MTPEVQNEMGIHIVQSNSTGIKSVP